MHCISHVFDTKASLQRTGKSAAYATKKYTEEHVPVISETASGKMTHIFPARRIVQRFLVVCLNYVGCCLSLWVVGSSQVSITVV